MRRVCGGCCAGSHDAAAVLDGGLGKWLREQRPVTAELPRPTAVRFEPRLRPLVVDARASSRRSARLNEARGCASGERYRGESEPIDPVAGHIPGSLNRFVRENLDGGAFKPPVRLREVSRAPGESAPGTIVHSCGSGVAACHNLLAMEVAGSRRRLYPGSWSEWIADPARPRAHRGDPVAERAMPKAALFLTLGNTRGIGGKGRVPPPFPGPSRRYA
jgi:thiosulfate/3-mercaptopyruvate sulfurtransferase